MPKMKTLTKLVVAGAMAVPTLGATAVIGLAGGGPAGATTTPPPAKGTVHCSTVTGKITFVPPLTLNGTSTVTQSVAKVRASATGCTASAGNSPSIGSVAAKIVTNKPSGNANSCTNLATPRPLKLRITWTNPVPVAPSVVKFSNYKVVTNKAGDAGFSLPGTNGTAGVTGSYADGNAGATSHATVYSNETEAQIAAACSSTGLATLKIKSGSAALK